MVVPKRRLSVLALAWLCVVLVRSDYALSHSIRVAISAARQKRLALDGGEPRACTPDA